VRRLAVVVDLQRGFVPDGSSVPGRVERLLDGHDGPVGLTRFVNAPDSPTRALGYDALPPGDPAGELHPVAARARDGGASTFEKSGYSAFDAPGFAAFVERVDPDRTLVCGLET
jgi:nicotinamidase-related amidase